MRESIARQKQIRESAAEYATGYWLNVCSIKESQRSCALTRTHTPVVTVRKQRIREATAKAKESTKKEQHTKGLVDGGTGTGTGTGARALALG